MSSAHSCRDPGVFPYNVMDTWRRSLFYARGTDMVWSLWETPRPCPSNLCGITFWTTTRSRRSWWKVLSTTCGRVSCSSASPENSSTPSTPWVFGSTISPDALCTAVNIDPKLVLFCREGDSWAQPCMMPEKLSFLGLFMTAATMVRNLKQPHFIFNVGQ